MILEDRCYNYKSGKYYKTSTKYNRSLEKRRKHISHKNQKGSEVAFTLPFSSEILELFFSYED